MILLFPPDVTISSDRGKFDMQRLKNTGTNPTPRPIGNWLVGAMIGAAIMTMATQAMLLGAGAAIKDATLKRG
jgi:hypothetical protein